MICKHLLHCCLALALLSIAGAPLAHAATSSDYALTPVVLDGGGGVSSSVSFSLLSANGQTTGVGSGAVLAYAGAYGFIPCVDAATEGEGEGEGEGSPEGAVEGEGEGQPEGALEGEGSPEGATEGEGGLEGEGAYPLVHSADWKDGPDGYIDLSELLRMIQFFNSGGFHCAQAGDVSDEGYMPGPDETAWACVPHCGDYNPQDWEISLSELLRVIQFFNSDGYHLCVGSEDGFCPGQGA
jgi:hypothetical protein